MLSDSNIDALAATTEALQLVPVAPPSALRAAVLSAHAHASGDRQRDDDAARWADEALAARPGAGPSRGRRRRHHHVGSAGGAKRRSGGIRRALRKIAADARENGDGATELRALHHLGGIHYEQGQLDEALEMYLLATERARSLSRPWAPYALDARLLAGIVAYQRGDWASAESIVDVSGQSPPGIAEAALAAVGMFVSAGRGDQRALGLLPHIRQWWHRDGFIAILSGGTAIDLYGDEGDFEAAAAIHDDTVNTVGPMWES